MAKATVTAEIDSSNRVTISKAVRKKLGVGPGDVVEIEVKYDD